MRNIKWSKATPPDFDNVPEMAGIYVISTLQNTDNEYEAKYIGQTNNLQTRAKKHWSTSEENKDLKDHIAKGYIMKFSYSKVSLSQDRDGMELYLYNTYDPPYNFNSPPGETTIQCNLPAVRRHD